MEDLKIVDQYLKEASEYGLQVELVTYALKYMKENPSLTIAEALNFAFLDWIK